MHILSPVTDESMCTKYWLTGIRWSDRENAQGDLCFSGSYFSSFHSTQLTLITADSAVIKVLGKLVCIDVFMPYSQAIYFFPKTS